MRRPNRLLLLAALAGISAHALAAGNKAAGTHAGAKAAAAKSFGFDAAGMDRSAVPGNDFFEYADGTYVKNLVIPPDQTGYGAFNILRDLSEARTRTILEQHAKALHGTPSKGVDKAAAVFKAFMDEKTVEARGATPLQPDFDLVSKIKTVSDFARLNGQATTGFLGSIFDISIQPDSKDPTKYAVTLSQSGLGMPDRDYYLSDQFKDKAAKYPAFVEHMLVLANYPQAHDAAIAVVDFEKHLAEVSWSRAERRDDDKTYNPITLDALKKAAPGFDWDAYFAGAGMPNPQGLVLSENTAITKMAAIAGAMPVSTLKAWAAFHLVLNASPVLSSPFDQAHFDFVSHELQGQPAEKPRWKRAVAAAEMTLGNAIGQAYFAAYFPPEARAQMTKLTDGLRAAFHERLEHNDWMTPQTRAKALEKLATFDFQIGAPKKWRDYAALQISSNDLYGDIERATAFEWNFWLGHLGHPVDRDEWEMFPQTVNAYNEPLLNEVVFPAAILQPPFFDPKADAAINYGAIGGVIGHEMTHSFDDQGRKHDAMGRLNNWWTAADAAAFEARAKKFGAQYAAMDVLPGAHINPALTMGENIADLGGLTMALTAYHMSLNGQPAPVIDGFTGDQRVFLGWAQVWRGKVRDDAARQRLTVDPHSPPKARVNGPMHNIDDWYTAFDVKPGETLYLKPEDRVKIW